MTTKRIIITQDSGGSVRLAGVPYSERSAQYLRGLGGGFRRPGRWRIPARHERDAVLPQGHLLAGLKGAVEDYFGVSPELVPPAEFGDARELLEAERAAAAAAYRRRILGG